MSPRPPHEERGAGADVVPMWISISVISGWSRAPEDQHFANAMHDGGVCGGGDLVAECLTFVTIDAANAYLDQLVRRQGAVDLRDELWADAGLPNVDEWLKRMRSGFEVCAFT